jgi:hypothetical protein
MTPPKAKTATERRRNAAAAAAKADEEMARAKREANIAAVKSRAADAVLETKEKIAANAAKRMQVVETTHKRMAVADKRLKNTKRMHNKSAKFHRNNPAFRKALYEANVKPNGNSAFRGGRRTRKSRR